MLLLSLGCALGCSNLRDPPASVPGQRAFTDEAGRLVHVPPRIERLVSLAPNLTETVYAIGAGQRLVGNTTYCDYPEEAKHVAKVGDTLQPSVERILALRPQLILISTASQLEAFTQQLNDQNISVYVTDPRDLEGVYRSILNLGQLLNQEKEAMALTATLRLRTEAVERAVANRQPVKLFYQLSAEPLYTAGRDAFVTDIIRRAGGKSVTAEVPGAWPKYSAESALASQAEAIILPTGGSMGEANAAVAGPLRLSPAFTNGKIYKINDDHLTRPGPRAVEGLEALARALHPEAFNK
ncbi:MAG TPA: helical backbone metal receptor [Pyrinomonadaceae bacterium]|nr:helical backbone metal receptor [Pyrinomonadaceae bacterium]